MKPLTGSQKWAVLLCKFKDSSSPEQVPASFFKNLVTLKGTDGLNDYWHAVSHGRINLDGSTVHGWRTLPYSLDEFRKFERFDKIYNAAKVFSGESERDQGVYFPGYYGIIVVANEQVTDGGSAGLGPVELELNGIKQPYAMVLVNYDVYNCTFIAHETGHGFGFNHSFDDSTRKAEVWSAPGEYFDRSDIMSAMGVDAFQHAEFGPSGPILNAAKMMAMGWLDKSRVWKYGGQAPFEKLVPIVPLSRPELSGYLAIEIDGFMVEFRMPFGFDKGLPRSGVFIRKYLDEYTVIQSSDLANFVQDWQAGQTFTIRAGKSLIKSEPPTWEGLFLDVVSIDSHTSQALIRVRAGAPLPSELGGVTVLVTLGGVGTGGGGWIILPSGKVKKIPPQDPLREVVSLLGVAASVDQIEEAEDAAGIRQSAVSALRRLAELDVPAPGL